MRSGDKGTTADTRLRTCTISKIVQETPTIKTFFFKDDVEVIPGQFVMVWLPGVDEIPMSVSYIGSEKAITVANVGPTTSKLHELEVGSKLGIRGPFGNGFDISNATNILAVSGGCGSAPIAPVLDEAKSRGLSIKLALGARTSNELLFKSRALELGISVDISTDDGTEGHHGFVTERVIPLLDDENYDLVVACGPELMMKKLVELTHSRNIRTQVSLERYMKCGIGICDACSIDGLQVCRDGPVFDSETVSKLEEFGRSKRDPCGRSIEF
jgi:dihydroorotate dehydrogenase electron transfer subunit